MNLTHKKFAIIGGGIAGLAAAYRVRAKLPTAKIVLFELNNQLGGVLRTEQVDGYLIERSADMFTTEPTAASELCQELGKADELLTTKPVPDRAFIANANSIHPVPRGLSLMLPGDLQAIKQTQLLDEAGKARFLSELDVPASDWLKDESLESFAVRRFGREAFDNLFQPLVGGIYTADPKKLSMKATLARFVEMEKQFGSLIRAAESSPTRSEDANASGARYGMFRAPKKGMGELVGWLRASLVEKVSSENSFPVELKTGVAVGSIRQTENGWAVKFGDEVFDADGVVLACSASQAGKLVRDVDEALSAKLSTIEGASSAIAVLGFDQTQMDRHPNFSGYGIVVPSKLNRNVIATSFASNKFVGRADEGKMLVRCFIGGALQAELVDRNDEELIEIAISELRKTVGFVGTPELTRVFRWRNCMPQYHLGHLDRVGEITALEAKHSGLELAGNSYSGVGIPACIESANRAVSRLVKDFA